jgi:hypothetical protein
MAQRGRPRKNDTSQADADYQFPSEELLDESEINSSKAPSDSGVVGDGTYSDYNPFADAVVERDYATPKTASGVTEEIEEPSFVPPSYEDIVNERNQMEEVASAENSPFSNPNPAMNELDERERRIACESLVDTCLDAYEQAHRFAQHIVKVDEEDLLQRQAEGKLDLSAQIPVAENGDTMSVGEFVGQYNEQSASALKYDKEFGIKVRPAMIRVFMKRGWGMTDEQFLIYMFGKDIAIKLGMMYSLNKTIKSTLATLEKAHARTKSSYSSPVYESNTTPPSPSQQSRQQVIYEDEIPTYEAEEVSPQDIPETFTSKSTINMPNNPKDKMASHPKEVRNILRDEQ